MTREEKVAQAQALRASGLMWREVGERMGISTSMAHDYVADPTGEKASARRHKKHGICKDCGTKTWSGGSLNLPERCSDCANEFKRTCSRRWIIESIDEWADLFGVPPSATDWNQAHARAQGAISKIERYQATGRPWPSVILVQQNFGSWNAGLEAAGWEARPPGTYGRDGEDIAVCEDTARRYLEGMRTCEIAAQDGISDSTVRYRLKRAGVPRRSLAESAQLRRANRAA